MINPFPPPPSPKEMDQQLKWGMEKILGSSLSAEIKLISGILGLGKDPLLALLGSPDKKHSQESYGSSIFIVRLH